jgi:hypothetical protein
MDIVRSYSISGLTGICLLCFSMFLVTTASVGHGDVPVLIRIIGSLLIIYKQLLNFFSIQYFLLLLHHRDNLQSKLQGAQSTPEARMRGEQKETGKKTTPCYKLYPIC